MVKASRPVVRLKIRTVSGNSDAEFAEERVASYSDDKETEQYAVVAQLVERLPSKQEVAGSCPVYRSSE